MEAAPRRAIERAGSGLTLVEVVVAMLILGFGVLALGLATGRVMHQIEASELRGERMAAVRQAAEILGGTPWDSLEASCSGPHDFSTEHYNVDCDVERKSNLKRVRLVTVGPGFLSGRREAAVADTFVLSLARPALP